jgi:hypothetical protein
LETRKTSEVLLILSQASQRFWIALTIFGGESSELSQARLVWYPSFDDEQA